MKKGSIFLGSCDYVLKEQKNIGQYFCNSINEDNSLSTKDRLDLQTYIIEKRIAKTILTGNEEWHFDEISKTYYYFQENKYHKYCGGKNDKMLCTHFKWIPFSNYIEYGEFQGGPNNEIMFNFDNGKNGINYFKHWLKEQCDKGCPVEVQYIMQYPEIIKLEKKFNPIPRFKVHHIEVISGEIDPDVKKTYTLNFESSSFKK